MKYAALPCWLIVVCIFAGCVSIYDRSDKYRDFIGKQFKTRSELKLCKMKRHNYDVVPYELKSMGSSGDPAATVIGIIPAGTVITVKDAKVSYIGGDWDFIIAEIRHPLTGKNIIFEEMLGFSSVDPKEFFKRFAPIEEQPNQLPEPAPLKRHDSS